MQPINHPAIKNVLWCDRCQHFFWSFAVTYAIDSKVICYKCWKKGSSRMNFQKFVRKPVEVDAVQFFGDTLDCLKYDSRVTFTNNGTATLQTPEGQETVNFEDWIVRGPMGELSVVKADEFCKTHDAWSPCPRPRRRSSSEVDSEG